MNILVLDDHTYLKEGVELRIKELLPHANCIFSTDIKGASVKVIEEDINLVVCDLDFSNECECDGFEFMHRVRESRSDIKVIAFTNYNSYRVLNKARKAGFNSYLVKSCSVDEFHDTLRNVIENDGEYISLSMKNILKKRYKHNETVFSDSFYGINNLSSKEINLLILSAETTDRNKLAKKISKSPFTVDAYYKSILKKLNLKSRSEVQFFAKEFMEELLKMKRDLDC